LTCSADDFSLHICFGTLIYQQNLFPFWLLANACRISFLPISEIPSGSSAFSRRLSQTAGRSIADIYPLSLLFSYTPVQKSLIAQTPWILHSARRLD